jgi:DNA-binding IclR family transcriptional regulator
VPTAPRARPRPPTWSFLTNHARVLACLAAAPAARMRAVAARLGVTERAVQRIIAELAAGGYVTVTKAGRTNRYAVNRRRALRHPMHVHRTAGELIDLAGQKEG